MSVQTVAAVRALVAEHPILADVLSESVEDNCGEVLPHLILADVMRWLASHVESEQEVCIAIVRWLELEYERGTSDVRDLIAVSGVEMIPDPGQPGSQLRTMLGPTLRSVDPWLPWGSERDR
ncbi:hypothetical protein ARHIZOSPH14_25180 [Agromyces rhizosphaerae]|uniref:DUF7674 domain-containing protein n=1 Tax=Agromyces rhizosphaerae TaxID=88374 RepID=A0A9W6FQ71_9MICO|nr:hypothetical protein [Agromyces rhizosphaerae]GLI28276.1 hypothetical protein ARHIZOSPH14_25180 [Agromyces rhizosphaerae]